MERTKKTRIVELDALRGMAAFIVVLFHFTMGTDAASLGFNLGTTGVDLFFIISGFVIYMSLNNIRNGTDFVINRLARLYPTYLTSVIITFLLTCIVSIFGGIGQINAVYFFANLTMFEFYFNIPYLDGAYWTMTIEMQFYLGIFILYYFKILRYSNLTGITLSILVVLLTQNYLDNVCVRNIIKWLPILEFIPLFTAGTLFYRIYSTKCHSFFIYTLISMCLICQLFLYPYAGSYVRFVTHFEYTFMLIIYFVLFTLFVNNWLGFVVNRISVFLGKISYALYLTHLFLSQNVMIPFLSNRMHINLLTTWLITLITVIIVATLITFYIEIPFGKLFKMKLREFFDVCNRVIRGWGINKTR